MKFKEVRIRFWNGHIDAIENEQGEQFVFPKRVCEAFGLTWAPQCRKLQKAHWAQMEAIFWEDARGYRRKVQILPVESLPMWLLLIHPKKVGDYARKQLINFQTEATAVLRRDVPIPDWIVKEGAVVVLPDDTLPQDLE